ncbi:hypothetical protein [Streptomyces purpureus]|uniref:AraC-like ligand-binding domain-containing protein n=1 Tax=Streptomyces purpureus TaxID=1951 RepID=UPI00037CA920|nr:hypothetical protein [Streptomyces purpureus]
MWSFFSSAGVPPPDRFGWWSDLVSREAVASEFTTDHVDDFRSEIGVLDLGRARLISLSHPTFRARRTHRLTRRSDREMYHLILASDNPLWMTQRRNESGLVRNSLMLFDSSHPYEAAVTGEAHVRCLKLQVPKDSLALHADKVGRSVVQRMPCGSGMGAILARLLTSLVEQGPALSAPDVAALEAAALERSVLDLV